MNIHFVLYANHYANICFAYLNMQVSTLHKLVTKLHLWQIVYIYACIQNEKNMHDTLESNHLKYFEKLECTQLLLVHHTIFTHNVCGKSFCTHNALVLSYHAMHDTNFVADWLKSILQTWSLFQLAKCTQLHAERHNYPG